MFLNVTPQCSSALKTIRKAKKSRHILPKGIFLYVPSLSSSSDMMHFIIIFINLNINFIDLHHRNISYMKTKTILTINVVYV